MTTPSEEEARAMIADLRRIADQYEAALASRVSTSRSEEVAHEEDCGCDLPMCLWAEGFAAGRAASIPPVEDFGYLFADGPQSEPLPDYFAPKPPTTGTYIAGPQGEAIRGSKATTGSTAVPVERHVSFTITNWRGSWSTLEDAIDRFAADNGVTLQSIQTSGPAVPVLPTEPEEA